MAVHFDMPTGKRYEEHPDSKLGASPPMIATWTLPGFLLLARKRAQEEKDTPSKKKEKDNGKPSHFS